MMTAIVLKYRLVPSKSGGGECETVLIQCLYAIWKHRFVIDQIISCDVSSGSADARFLAPGPYQRHSSSTLISRRRRTGASRP